VLKAFYGVHEVVVTIMLNYIAFYLANHFVSVNASEDSAVKTNYIAESANLNIFQLQNFFDGARIH